MPKTSSSALEAIVRDNVTRLIKKHYQGKPGQMSRLNKNVNLRGVQDFLAGGSCYLSSIQSWADALHVKAYHLMIKDLNLEDLPEVISAARLKRFEMLRKELLEEEK